MSPRFMEVMGVQPVAGRLFRGDDVHSDEAIVGEAFAREHFGSAEAAIGQVIQYGGPHPIVGVVPEAFAFPGKTHVWMEEAPVPATPSRTAYNQRAVAKRRADVTPEQLAAELANLSLQLQHAYPENVHKLLETVPLQNQIVERVRPTLKLLMGSVGVVLLILCVNITHLQLVRATRQLRSVADSQCVGSFERQAGGAVAGGVTLLAMAGSLAALLLAIPALRLLVRLAPPGLSRLAEVHLNADVFLFRF